MAPHAAHTFPGFRKKKKKTRNARICVLDPGTEMTSQNASLKRPERHPTTSSACMRSEMRERSDWTSSRHRESEALRRCTSRRLEATRRGRNASKLGCPFSDPPRKATNC